MKTIFQIFIVVVVVAIIISAFFNFKKMVHDGASVMSYHDIASKELNKPIGR